MKNRQTFLLCYTDAYIYLNILFSYLVIDYYAQIPVLGSEGRVKSQRCVDKIRNTIFFFSSVLDLSETKK